jgi:serine/threonine protein kinase
VHRDIKPDNILIMEANDLSTIKLADFGLATYYDIPLEAICGSALYISPDMFLPGGYDFKVDIYSLGIVLYQCLT